MTQATIIQRAEDQINGIEYWITLANGDEIIEKPLAVLKELLAYAKELEARVQSSALSLKSLGDENFENIEKRKSFEAKVNELETVLTLNDAEVTLFERCRALEAKVKELEKRCAINDEVYEKTVNEMEDVERIWAEIVETNKKSLVDALKERDALQKRIDGGFNGNAELWGDSVVITLNSEVQRQLFDYAAKGIEENGVLILLPEGTV